MRVARRALAASLVIVCIVLGVPIYSALYGGSASPLRFSVRISEARGVGIASSFPNVLPFSLEVRYLRFSPVGGSESARLQMMVQPPWFGTKLAVREAGTGEALLDWVSGPLVINATFAWMDFISEVDEQILGATANATFPRSEPFPFYTNTTGWLAGWPAEGLEFLLSQGHDLRMAQNRSGEARLFFFGKIYQAPAFEPGNCSITISDSSGEVTLDQPAVGLLLDGVGEIQTSAGGTFSVYTPDWESIAINPTSRFSMTFSFSRGTLAFGTNGKRDLQGTEEVSLEGVEVGQIFQVSRISGGVSATLDGETSHLFVDGQELGGSWDYLSHALTSYFPYLGLAVVLIGLVAFHQMLFLTDRIFALLIGALFTALCAWYGTVNGIAVWGVLTTVLTAFWVWYARARKSRFKRLISGCWRKPLRDELEAIQRSVSNKNRAENSVLIKSISDWQKTGRFYIDAFYPWGWLDELRELSTSVATYDRAWSVWNDQVSQFGRRMASREQVVDFLDGRVEWRKDSKANFFTPFASGTNDMRGASIGPDVYAGLQELKQKTDQSEYTGRCKDQSWKREVQDGARRLVDKMDKFLEGHRLE